MRGNRGNYEEKLKKAVSRKILGSRAGDEIRILGDFPHAPEDKQKGVSNVHGTVDA